MRLRRWMAGALVIGTAVVVSTFASISSANIPDGPAPRWQVILRSSPLGFGSASSTRSVVAGDPWKIPPDGEPAEILPDRGREDGFHRIRAIDDTSTTSGFHRTRPIDDRDPWSMSPVERVTPPLRHAAPAEDLEKF